MEQSSNNLALLELLSEEAALTGTNLQLLEAFQKKWEVSAFEAILETHLLSEAQLADLLANHFNVQRLYAIAIKDLKPENYARIDYFTARKYGVFPIGKSSSSGAMRVVVYDPTCRETLRFLEETFSEWELVVAERNVVIEAINRLYPISSQIPHLRSHEELLDE